MRSIQLVSREAVHGAHTMLKVGYWFLGIAAGTAATRFFLTKLKVVCLTPGDSLMLSALEVLWDVSSVMAGVALAVGCIMLQLRCDASLCSRMKPRDDR